MQATAEEVRTKQRVCIDFSIMVYGLAVWLLFLILAFGGAGGRGQWKGSWGRGLGSKFSSHFPLMN